jgi:hypothetical protein
MLARFSVRNDEGAVVYSERLNQSRVGWHPKYGSYEQRNYWASEISLSMTLLCERDCEREREGVGDARLYHISIRDSFD